MRRAWWLSGVWGLFLLSATAVLPAETLALFSSSGRLQVEDVIPLQDSPDQDPSLLGRLKLNFKREGWGGLSVIEGGWDGTVEAEPRDRHLLKSYREVYQNNTPYLEFKELYLERRYSSFDLRVGIQRFAWGRLDEYPPTDILNPWDFTRFLTRSLEDRKIGIPAVALSFERQDDRFGIVWIPVLVPYRLALPGERWALSIPDVPSSNLPVTIRLQEADLPARTLSHSEIGFRFERTRSVEWAISFFSGYDRRPVFAANQVRAEIETDEIVVDPGFFPSFHRIWMVGGDAAWIVKDVSFRVEAAYINGRRYNLRPEFWGAPPGFPTGAVPMVIEVPLQPIQVEIDTFEYGISADYRLMEETFLTVQIQQTALTKQDARLASKRFESILWGSLRRTFLNARWEMTLGGAWNVEHDGYMARCSAFYTFSDSWKVGGRLFILGGEPQSLFGQYRKNDQAEVDLFYFW